MLDFWKKQIEVISVGDRYTDSFEERISVDDLYRQFKDRLTAEEEKPSVEIDWEDAPEWANWIGANWKGCWMWFEREPIQSTEGDLGGGWVEFDGKGQVASSIPKTNLHWTKTLVRRPL